ncbi:hypothetical protein BLOT_010928 [Blomia tropicalis]|nr:hypothetical protein BLOT_010928 [Blomia tropicalis]
MSRSRGMSSTELCFETARQSSNKNAQNARLQEFKQKSTKFSVELESNEPIQTISSKSDLETRFRYRLEDENDQLLCTFVGQSNSGGYGSLFRATLLGNGHRREKVFCRIIDLAEITASGWFKILKSLKIGQKIGKFGSHSKHMLSIRGMFYNQNYEMFYVFTDRYNLENSLQHHLSNNFTDLSTVKQWIIQLANAAEFLNLHAISNRFIRLENVITTGNNSPKDGSIIKIINFDMAWMFWNPNTNTSINSPKRGLPVPVALNLLDHLPPEAFSDNYDCSMIDVWSIGVIACLLLSGENPFIVTKVDKDEGVRIIQWQMFQIKVFIPEEIRSLLNDIFIESELRIPLNDLVKDRRLEEMTQIKSLQFPQYSRNDKKSSTSKSSLDLSTPRLSGENSSNCLKIFKFPQIDKIQNEELIVNYRIERNRSFEDDMIPFMDEGFLRVTRLIDGKPCSRKCLGKILLKSIIPIRQWNQFIMESSKIMRFMSDNEPCNRYIHRLYDMYNVGNGNLYMFFEDLDGRHSLKQLVESELIDGQLPPALNSLDKKLSVSNIIIWIEQLSQTIVHLSSNGLCHRYIRPEFVFVALGGCVKLTHGELSCFTWNPTELIVVKRNRGIQDECLFQWDHLPPECFDNQYNASMVDVWSLGVLLIYSLTKKMIFNAPLSLDTSQHLWREFKENDGQRLIKSHMTKFIEILERIFTPLDCRIQPKELNSILQPLVRKTSDIKKTGIGETSFIGKLKRDKSTN